MAEGRSRVWLWLLCGGGAFLLFVVAVFTLVYFTFRGGDQESFSGFGEKIKGEASVIKKPVVIDTTAA